MIIDYTLNGSSTPMTLWRWRTSILRIRSAVVGTMLASEGLAASAHQRPSRWQLIDYGSEIPLRVLHRNGMQDVSSRIKLDSIQSLATVLQNYGPVIVCGKFAMFNSMWRPMIIRGCNTQTGEVLLYDAGFLGGNSSKPWSYIVKHVRKAAEAEPGKTTFVADDPHPSALLKRGKKKRG